MPAARITGTRAQYGRRRGFTPFRAPTRPPPGTFDPSLYAAVRASDRGYHDLQQDTARNQARAADDFAIATGNVDYQTNSALADAFLGGTRTVEDYGRNTADLERSYRRQASSQNQAANAAGVLEPGYLAQALAAREGNQAHDQSGLDLSRDRSLADLKSGADRAVYAGGQAKGALSLGFGRGNEDLATALERAGREHTAFGQDTNEAAFFEAQGTGWSPPVKPKNEHKVGRFTYRVGPHGRVTRASGREYSAEAWRHFLRAHGLRV